MERVAVVQRPFSTAATKSIPLEPIADHVDYPAIAPFGPVISSWLHTACSSQERARRARIRWMPSTNSEFLRLYAQTHTTGHSELGPVLPVPRSDQHLMKSSARI